MGKFLKNSRRTIAKLRRDIVAVGHPSAPIGMGEHVRSVFRALKEAGAAPGILDIYGPSELADQDLIATYSSEIELRLSSRLNIFCINGDEVEGASKVLLERDFLVPGSKNVIYPAWELEKYPQEWAEKLDLFDEIWAPSMFIKESIQAVADKPVVHMPLACEIGRRSLRSRKHFGIRDSSYCFFFAFDFLSYIDRKNPYAVIDAFTKLLDERPYADVQLVIKVNNINRRPAMRRKFEDAIASCGDRVVVVEDVLSDLEMKSLVWLTDCFVSLHRSEGFGRGMTEAMVLGKPVIATAYSGNMDFCSQDTAILIPYELISVAPGSYPHWQGQRWADPDVDAATAAMRRLVDDPKFALALGERARLRIRKEFSFLTRGVDYLTRSMQLIAA